MISGQDPGSSNAWITADGSVSTGNGQDRREADGFPNAWLALVPILDYNYRRWMVRTGWRGVMAYYLGTVLFFVIWIGGWLIIGRWGRRKGSYNTETLAWLMGGISALMGIFALLNMELRYLEYLK